MAPSSSSSNPPCVGVSIGGNWQIGAKLGSGACASVHRLDTKTGNPTEFAIKVTPVPTKVTKKKNSIPEQNASSLYYEGLMYHNHFPDLQGSIIPRVSSGTKGSPPPSGQSDGFQFLVMEQMEHLLSDAWTLLVKESKQAKVPFGPIAVKMLQCIQALHDHNHIFIDVKAENFMVAPPTTKKQKGKSASTKGAVVDLASRIRILDLGLVRPWRSAVGGSHRPNEGSKMAGTPLYISLNVHHGETPSRRDDLESLGYVIAELLTQATSVSKSTQNVLPWSNGKSDEEIYRIKESNVQDPKSLFYDQLGNATVIKTFQSYLDEVRSYAYKQTPDYDHLETILSKLEVSTTTASPSSSSSTMPTTTTTKKRANIGRTATNPPSTTNKSTRTTRSTAARARQTTRATSKSTTADLQDDDTPHKVARCEVIDICSDSEDDSFQDAQDDTVYSDALDETIFSDARQEDGVTEMDWEYLPTDENDEPIGTGTSTTTSKKCPGVLVTISAGPHKGDTIQLIQAEGSDSVVIGRNPKPKKSGDQLLALPDDNALDDAHVRLELSVAKKLVGVRVTDLKSSAGCYIGSERIRAGKDVRVFVSQTLRIGESTLLRFRPIDKQLRSTSSNMDVPDKIFHTKYSSDKQQQQQKQTQSESQQPMDTIELPRLARRGVRLEITDGPHSGEFFVMESGGAESLIIGSNPSSKSNNLGNFLVLKEDHNIHANHIRLELIATKGLTAVNVVDLKSGRTTIINRNFISKGKSSRAFLNDKVKIGDTVIAIKSL